MDRPNSRRKLNKEEEEAALNILAKLPRDLVVNLLKTTNLSIADVLHFCEINVWSFKLCDDKGVWDEIYEKRFANRELRKAAETILRQQVAFKDPVTKLIVQIRFSPVFVQLVNIINGNRHVLVSGAAVRTAIDRASKIISDIYGPIDPYVNDRFMWFQRFQDTLVTASIFRKMVIYTFLENGYKVEWTSGGNEDIACDVCSLAENVGNACSNCRVTICGKECFEKHEC